MKALIKEQQKSYENAKNFYICREKFQNNMLKMKIIIKLEIIFTIQMNIEVLHIAYAI